MGPVEGGGEAGRGRPDYGKAGCWKGDDDDDEEEDDDDDDDYDDDGDDEDDDNDEDDDDDDVDKPIMVRQDAEKVTNVHD